MSEKKYTLNEVASIIEELQLSPPASAYTGYMEKLDIVNKTKSEVARKLRERSLWE